MVLSTRGSSETSGKNMAHLKARRALGNPIQVVLDPPIEIRPALSHHTNQHLKREHLCGPFCGPPNR
jgi:hypothetical protein